MLATRSEFEAKNKEIEVWCNRYGLTRSQFSTIKRLIMLKIFQETKEINGDPFPMASNPSDKNENSKSWSKEREKTNKLLFETIKKLGFDGIDFGVGLYPALMKGNDRCIMVP